MIEKIENLINQGNYFLSRGRLEEGEEIFLEVLKYDDKNITALSNLGYIKYFQEKYEEGIDYCNKVLKLKPLDSYSHKGKGLHLAKLGRVEEGIEFLKKAIELDPSFPDPYYDLALTFYENGRYKEAKKYIFKGGKVIKDKKIRMELYKLLQLVEEKLN